MKRTLLPLLFSSVLFADCSVKQEREAMQIWKKSIHESDFSKEKLLNKAQKICPLEVIAIDKAIINTAKAPTLEKLQYLQNANNLLTVDKEYISHKYNNQKKIDRLFLNYFLKKQKELNKKGFFATQENRILSDRIKLLQEKPVENSVKAVGKIGGTYRADLLFDKSKYIIKDRELTNEIIKAIHNEVEKDNKALFGLEGGASSEGSSSFNKRLSKNRAEALKKEILKVYPNYNHNIKIFARGESELVCEGGLIPEKNLKGEYECLTKENREKSRRVAIRRLR